MLFILIFIVGVTGTSCKDLYSFTVKDSQGNDVSLEQYRGKVSLVVNVASECGFTNTHYQALVKFQEKFSQHVFQVLAFPSNQFGYQEPKNDVDIQSWTKQTFHINFPIFAKGAVVKEGIENDEQNQLPDLWQYLSEKAEPPTWNFWKYLIDPHGQIVHAYSPQIELDSVENAIKTLLLKHNLIDKTEL